MRKSIFISLIITVAFLLSPIVRAGTVDDGHCVVGATQGSALWYFAEGCTRPGFNTYLCLGNSNDQSVTAHVTYYLGNGITISKNCTIPANSRNTLLLNNSNDIGFRDNASGDVSIKVESTSGLPIIAERPMYFEGDYTGGHDVLGSTTLSKEWYFAEGYTGSGFNEWISVLNPGSTPATLTFYFQTQEAGEIVKSNIAVSSHSRQTFKINELLGPNFQTSLKIESNQPIVAERSIYFAYTGVGAHQWQGGHCVMGATSLGKEYYLSEGCTRYPNFEEWITLQNPSPETITVNITYEFGPGQGEPINIPYAIPAKYRRTIFVENEVGRDKDVSAKLASDSPFLAERPMYFQYQYEDLSADGGHCVIGASSTTSECLFAEGYTGSGFHEWLCLQNTSDDDANVTIDYLRQGSGTFSSTHSIPAHSRHTVMVNNDNGKDHQLSCHIESSSPVVVERPMYFTYGMIAPPPPPPTPTPAPTPTPTPTPPPSGLTVLDHTSYEDIVGYFHIVGEVKNNTTSNLEFCKIVATLYNSSGGVIGTDFTYTMLDILALQEKSPFTIITDKPPGFATYTLQSEYSTTASTPTRSLTIISQSSYIDAADYLHIVGEARNDSGYTIEYPKIVGTMYNSAGKVVDADSTYTQLNTLSPGQKSPFDLIISSSRAPLVHHWYLYTQYRVK